MERPHYIVGYIVLGVGQKERDQSVADYDASRLAAFFNDAHSKGYKFVSQLPHAGCGIFYLFETVTT